MSFFKKLLKIIAIIIAVIAIAFAIYSALYFVFAETAFLGLSAWQVIGYTVGGLILSAAISPEGFHEVVDPLSEGTKKVATTLGKAAGGLISSAASGVFSGTKGIFLTLGGIFLASKLFGTEDEEAVDQSPSTQNANVGVV
jgi:predicted MFS family arabinose efflux permease